MRLVTNIWSRCIGAIVVGSLLSIFALAQTGTSRVTGTVEDNAGAVVPGASVTLTNEATNVAYTTTSTTAGTYVFDGVQLGTYSLTFEMSGFKKYVSHGNVLTVGVPLTVNAKLEIGVTEDVIEVAESFERVQTSTSGNLGATVDNKTLTDLPLGLEAATGGRNPLIFVRLQPGVATGANTGGGSHVNGARDRAFNYTLDGIDINETSAGGSEFSPIRTNPDSLQEFRVITSNATAEFGRNSGAQVALATKSGTNSFHGNAFYFYRGSALSANEWQNNLNGIARPFLLQNQYGGDVGGPVIKDRTFFFFNFQGQRQTSPFTLTRTVYTPTVKQGIFRYLVGGRNNPANAAGAVVDTAGNPLFPACSASLTTNCIASYNIVGNDPRKLGIDPAIQEKELGLFPAPNNFTTGDGLNTAGFIFNGGRLDPQEDYVFRIDHHFNEKNSIFGRYSWGRQDTVNDTTNGGAPGFPGLPPKVNTERDPKNLAVSYRRVITPNLINELVGGYNRFTFNFINPSAGDNPYSIVTINPTDPLDFTVGNLRRLTTVQLVDNLSYVRGAHLIKAGANLRYQQHKDVRGSIGGQNAVPIVNIAGSAQTNTSCATGSFGAGGVSGVSGSGQELFCLPSSTAGTPLFINSNDLTRLQTTINDLLGRVGTVTQGFVATPDLFSYLPPGSLFLNDARYPEYDFYVQDTFRLRPNLTIDLGVRFEAKLTPIARNRLYTPNQPVSIGAPSSNTLRWEQHNLYNSDTNNWSPSIGFAWDPRGNGKTSIRANYRLAYDRINTFLVSSSIYNTIPGITLGAVNQSFGLTGGQGGTGGRIRDGIPSVAPAAGTSPFAQAQPAAFGVGSITIIDPKFQAPSTSMWSLDIQHELHGGILLDVAYIGRRANHLFGGYNANQVDIYRNGFLDAYNVVAAGGDSPLINQLYGPDSRRRTGETGSQFVRRQFATEISRNSVAAIAADAASRLEGGVPLLQRANLSPFFFRAYPQFATLNVIDSNDYSTYHSLQVMAQRKFAKGVQFQVSYTFSKSLDTRSFDPAFTTVNTGSAQSASSTPFDNNRRFLNYARSDFDRTHMLIGYGIWDLPFGQGQRFGASVPRALNALISGWNVNGVLTLQSGRPFTVYSGANQVSNVVNAPASCSNCPRDMGSVNLTASNFAGRAGYFPPDEIARFSQPAAGTIGNTGRNYFNGPGQFKIDAALLKRTPITERINFELRFEFFNLTNSPSFDFPTATLTSATFGRLDALVSESRKVRIGAKINF
jgi:hypothetical protein